MGIFGYLCESKGNQQVVRRFELDDWTIFNSLVNVAHVSNIHVHMVKFKNHPRHENKNRIASFLAQQNVYGDVFMYGVNDMNEIVHISTLEKFLRDMTNSMNGIPIINT
jgi:hypothetical protein